MDSLDVTQYKFKVDKEFNCGECKRLTGRRSYTVITKASIFAFFISIVIYPFMCCCNCFCLPFQKRRQFCANCNSEIDED